MPIDWRMLSWGAIPKGTSLLYCPLIFQQRALFTNFNNHLYIWSSGYFRWSQIYKTMTLMKINIIMCLFLLPVDCSYGITVLFHELYNCFVSCIWPSQHFTPSSLLSAYFLRPEVPQCRLFYFYDIVYLYTGTYSFRSEF